MNPDRMSRRLRKPRPTNAARGRSAAEGHLHKPEEAIDTGPVVSGRTFPALFTARGRS
jgi:hypothetical protein